MDGRMEVFPQDVFWAPESWGWPRRPSGLLLCLEMVRRSLRWTHLLGVFSDVCRFSGKSCGPQKYPVFPGGFTVKQYKARESENRPARHLGMIAGAQVRGDGAPSLGKESSIPEG